MNKSTEEPEAKEGAESQENQDSEESQPTVNLSPERTAANLFLCQKEIVEKSKIDEVFKKSLALLIKAREKMLLYDDHAWYARRKLKEARESLYLMDVINYRVAAEFEKKTKSVIKKLLDYEEVKMGQEVKAQMSHRIAEIEHLLRSLINQNTMAYDKLKKEFMELAQGRKKPAKRSRPLAARNANKEKKEDS